MSKLPKDFLWGASTSAYQVEGAWDTDGKGKSVQDVKTSFPQGVTDFKVASDHYNHFKEDVALMAEMGFKSYRFSISWTRILPNGVGEVNQKGIDFYNQLIDELLKYNIKPIVTIYHFDLPEILDNDGGWMNRKTIDAFEEFSRIIFENFGDRVEYFQTINEQNMMALVPAAILGVERAKTAKLKDIYQCNHHMFLASAKAYNLCHKIAPNAKIGPAPNITAIYPNSNKPEDFYAALNLSSLRNWFYLDLPVFGVYNKTAMNILKKIDAVFEIQPGDMDLLSNAKPDFIAFNYYTTATVKMPQDNEMVVGGDQQMGAKIPGFFEQVENNNLSKTQFGWEIDPYGFKNTLIEMYTRYNLPLLLTENGLGAYDELTPDGKVHDQYRIEFYQKHFKYMIEAVEEGVDLIGYNPWSAIDLVSTHEGIKKRYGFIYVDRTEDDLKECKRYRKDSFYWYKKVIETNGEDISN
ncbi:glycoside hydrolase family 1 protein [Spiroplasma culicicola]|uniref:6-phospho-beta-glucosidase n=1 Tax=Spiroplasma culicicola AES-1 TaxID=1276246 RepID=W6A6Y9_9MOLU|nr:glycoside hydrolase family 1 protein [Spiroplasma culicicola]AHI52752.1 6-phospho-beta-glucosidase [Spiroplasma culicicola AES-1]